ncbi:hypothetical protein [Bartonella florencae]|nr:hypothetical protein [Bartonella florencae]
MGCSVWLMCVVGDGTLVGVVLVARCYGVADVRGSWRFASLLAGLCFWL